MHLTMLPAGEGDALWLRWGPASDRRQLLVDLGVNATGKAFRKRLATLPEAQRAFELLVVTHVDTDHIYGVLSGLVTEDPLPGLTFKDVWFNGWTHLDGHAVEPLEPGLTGTALAENAAGHLFGNELEPFGGKQGEQFSIWLRNQKWNDAFQGGPVRREDAALGPAITLAHDLHLTVLGPTQTRLTELKPKWRRDVEAALKNQTLDPNEVSPDLVPGGLEPMGRSKPTAPKLDSTQSLETLADGSSTGDTSAPNGSSIALLLEYGNMRMILAGDAFPEDLIDAVALLDPDRRALTLFKLPHHGSQNNVSTALVEAVSCRHWLVSSNGAKHYHPDAAAVARVVKYGQPASPVLHFNEPSPYNSWWDNPAWREKHGYETAYGSKSDGLTLVVAQDGSVVAGREFT